MIYKMIGCLLLLGTGGYVALSLRRFEHRRLRVLDGYIALLYYIKGQIECYARPLPDILAAADPAILAACLGLDRPRSGDPPPVPTAIYGDTILPALVRESRIYLEPESERLLTTFTGEVGHTFRTEQVARCDYYIEALTEERHKLYSALPARLRTGSVLALCCAIGAAVILW